MAGHCQDCDGCCRVFEVASIGKQFGEPCWHLGKTAEGPGCKIYAERPLECRTYVCLWLDSQRKPGKEFDEKLRPDVCKVVMGYPQARDRETLMIYPYPGHEDSWRVPPVSDYLREILARGAKVVVLIRDKRIVLKGDTAIIGTEAEFAELLI